MHLTSSSSVNLPRASSAGAEVRRDAVRGATTLAEGAGVKRRQARGWRGRWLEKLGRGWKALEAFLVDYYRACGVVATVGAGDVGVPGSASRGRRVYARGNARVEKRGGGQRRDVADEDTCERGSAARSGRGVRVGRVVSGGDRGVGGDGNRASRAGSGNRKRQGVRALARGWSLPASGSECATRTRTCS